MPAGNSAVPAVNTPAAAIIMVKSTTAVLLLAPASRAKTVGARIREIRPYELLIFFILLVLLALCIVVAQVVVQDVDTRDAAPDGAPGAPRYHRHRVSEPAGLDAAFEWGF